MEFSGGFKDFWNINPEYLWWIALFYTPLVSVPLVMSIPDKKRGRAAPLEFEEA